MTFTGTSVDVARLVGTPFAVTAAAPFLPIAQALVVEMGGEPSSSPRRTAPSTTRASPTAPTSSPVSPCRRRRILAEAGIENPALYVRPLLEAALDRALTEGVAGISGPAAAGMRERSPAHARSLGAREGLSGEHDTYADMTRALTRLLRDARLLDERAATSIEAALLDPGA